MRPFCGKRNKDGISDIYTKYHYKFADLPVCSKNRPSCGSKYLFCHAEKELCLPRIKPGGSCEGLHIYISHVMNQTVIQISAQQKILETF